jgi:hypothetical protein
MAVLGPPGGVGDDGLPVLWPAATPGEFTGDDGRGEDYRKRTSVRVTKSDCVVSSPIEFSHSKQVEDRCKCSNIPLRITVLIPKSNELCGKVFNCDRKFGRGIVG